MFIIIYAAINILIGICYRNFEMKAIINDYEHRFQSQISNYNVQQELLNTTLSENAELKSRLRELEARVSISVL